MLSNNVIMWVATKTLWIPSTCLDFVENLKHYNNIPCAMVDLYFICQKKSIGFYFEMINLSMHMMWLFIMKKYQIKITMDL
jgi:hypothetical protein